MKFLRLVAMEAGNGLGAAARLVNGTGVRERVRGAWPGVGISDGFGLGAGAG